MVCLTDNTRNRVGVFDQVVVFYNGYGDAKDISLLESVFTQHPGNLLTTDDDHGNRVHLGGHDAGDGITSTRA